MSYLALPNFVGPHQARPRELQQRRKAKASVFGRTAAEAQGKASVFGRTAAGAEGKAASVGTNLRELDAAVRAQEVEVLVERHLEAVQGHGKAGEGQ